MPSLGSVASLACTCAVLIPAVAGAQDHGAMDHSGHAARGGAQAAAPAMLDGITVDFELTDRDGRLVTDEDLRGRHVLLAFGFTHCEHVCPLMAFNMAQALDGMGVEAVGVFISVDTERDSPTVTDDYASSFGPDMMGLGGSIDQINAAAKNFGVAYAVTKSEDSYTVQHTANIYLIDPDGDLVEVFALGATAAEIVDSL